MKKRYLAIILSLLIAYIGCSAERQEDVDNPVDELLKGWQEYNAGDYESAILSFEKVISGNVAKEIIGDAYNGLGWSYSYMSKDIGVNKVNISTAITKFQNAVSYDESNSDAWIGIASMFLVRRTSDDLNNAIKALDNTLTKDEKYLFRHNYNSKADVYALKAQCYYFLNDIENAKKEIDKSLALESSNNSAIILKMLLE